MTIKVNVITPEKLAFSDEVDFIAAPTSVGEIGILPRHAPLLSKLGIGELRLKKGEQVRFFAISGGFLEVQKGSRVQIFAETAEQAEEINAERARLAAENAQSQLKNAKRLTDVELRVLEASLSRALLRLKLAQVRRRPSQIDSPHS